MSIRRIISTTWLPVVASCLAIAGLLAGRAGLAGADTPRSGDDLLQAQLDTGEFAPALAATEKVADPRQRDARLAAVAQAQANAGARSAAYTTAADIYDDQARDRTLDEVSSQPLGGRGGSVSADFESLIELLTGTIAPTTWNEVGGAGAIKKYPGGVYVDAAGLMRRTKPETSLALADARESARQIGANREVRQRSTLRKVSLTRLEREVQLRLAAGKPLDDEMLLLAGLSRVQYIMVYRDSGDLVIAGPAGDWKADSEGRIVSTDNGHPLVRLEDLVVVLRHTLTHADARFGCSITPTQEALARTQQFVQDSKQKPIKAGRRNAWLEELRGKLGAQVIDVNGIDPGSRVAQVLVEADYRMKLVGLGLEEGVLGVPSYLSMIRVGPGQAPPPMDVLRWWFTMNYKALLTGPQRDVFEIRGQGVKVLSENELLTEAGDRVHTGESDLLNREFAHDFTEHFAQLAARYPIYSELQNIFDLALVSALVKHEGLAEQLGWHLTCFGPQGSFPIQLGKSPKTVDTVINHRVINSVHVVAAVSGGVTVEAEPLVKSSAIEVDQAGSLGSQRAHAEPSKLPRRAWWWD